MRSADNQVSITMAFPVERPDKNGVVYSRKAVDKALKSMPDNLPIIDLENNGDERVIGTTSSRPYAVQWDDLNGVCRFTIDGIVFFGETSCIVNAVNDDGEITDFTITSIGVSE